MNDYFRFVNNQGEIVNFGSIGLIIDENDLRDFAWSFTSQYGNIVDFKKGITKKKIKAKVYGENLNNLKNELFEKLEIDVLLKKKGKLYIGDYYIGGYFYSSKKTRYTIDGMTEITLGFVTDEQFWKKESFFNYRINGQESADERGVKYPYDYPYDYSSSVNVGYISNSSYAPCNFRLIIYGAIENPTAIIANHTYKVNTSIAADEYLTIDSLEKTVTVTDNQGNKTNHFRDRDLSAGYIFEKIPIGDVYTVLSTPANYDLIIIEERSEPEWI